MCAAVSIDDYLASVTVEDLDRDPYAVYRRCQLERPVAWVPAVELWFATSWAAVESAASDPETFSAGVTPSPIEVIMGPTAILLVDGEEQRRQRTVLDPSVRPRAVEAYAPPLLEPLVEATLERIASRGRAELMAEYFEPISVRSLALVMGLGELDDDTLRRWFADLAVGAVNFEADPEKERIGLAAAREVDSTLRPILERLLAEPDGSMVANMLAAVDGTLDERIAEIMPSLKVIPLGGMQEPGHACGSTALGLLSHPGQSEAFAADPTGLVRQVVEEGLRWQSPIGTQTRRTTGEVELDGTLLPAGANIGLLVSAANRDPAVWGPTVDAFDLHRPRRTQAAFGFGPHFCAGHHFSRLQMRLALSRLFARLPNLRLDPERPPASRGWEFRAPEHIHVVWDVPGG